MGVGVNAQRFEHALIHALQMLRDWAPRERDAVVLHDAIRDAYERMRTVVERRHAKDAAHDD